MRPASSFTAPAGSLRSGFEAAARAHAENARGERGPAPSAAPPLSAAAARSPVEAAIAAAATRTTVDFGYLVAQAEVESSMDPDARAATSSATGLYQFIDSTWLATMRRHGARFGLGALAAEISGDAGGGAWVADPARRAEILALRTDPKIAALMAAGLAEDNAAHLTPVLGREPDHGELYLAHFLGAGGAARFLSELQDNPAQSAAALFPRPAAANRAIFFAADGSPRSLGEVMGVLAGKMERALDRAGLDPAMGPARAFQSAPLEAPPYLIADEEVFGPGGSLLAGGGARPFQSAPQSAFQRAPQRAPMSEVIGATFGTEPSRAPEQVRRVYERLRGMGL